MSYYFQEQVSLEIDGAARLLYSNSLQSPLLAAISSSKVQVMNDRMGKEFIFEPENGPITASAWHPLQNSLILGHESGALTFLDASDGTSKSMEEHESPVTKISFSADKTMMVSQEKEGSVIFWREKNPIRTLRRTIPISKIFFFSFRHEVRDKGRKEAQLIFFGDRLGNVEYCEQRKLEFKQLCKVNGAVKEIFFYEKRNTVVIITSTYFMFRFRISTEEDIVIDNKVKIAMNNPAEGLLSQWLAPDSFVLCSGEPQLKFWSLEQDRHYSVPLRGEGRTMTHLFWNSQERVLVAVFAGLVRLLRCDSAGPPVDDSDWAEAEHPELAGATGTSRIFADATASPGGSVALLGGGVVTQFRAGGLRAALDRARGGRLVQRGWLKLDFLDRDNVLLKSQAFPSKIEDFAEFDGLLVLRTSAMEIVGLNAGEIANNLRVAGLAADEESLAGFRKRFQLRLARPPEGLRLLRNGYALLEDKRRLLFVGYRGGSASHTENEKDLVAAIASCPRGERLLLALESGRLRVLDATDGRLRVVAEAKWEFEEENKLLADQPTFSGPAPLFRAWLLQGNGKEKEKAKEKDNTQDKDKDRTGRKVLGPMLLGEGGKMVVFGSGGSPGCVFGYWFGSRRCYGLSLSSHFDRLTSLRWDLELEGVLLASGSRRGLSEPVHCVLFVRNEGIHFAESLSPPASSALVALAFPEAIFALAEPTGIEPRLSTVDSGLFAPPQKADRAALVSAFRKLLALFLAGKPLTASDGSGRAFAAFWRFAASKAVEAGEWRLAADVASRFGEARAALLLPDNGEAAPQALAFLADQPLAAVASALEAGDGESAASLFEAARGPKAAVEFCAAFDRLGLVDAEMRVAVLEAGKARPPLGPTPPAARSSVLAELAEAVSPETLEAAAAGLPEPQATLEWALKRRFVAGLPGSKLLAQVDNPSVKAEWSLWVDGDPAPARALARRQKTRQRLVAEGLLFGLDNNSAEVKLEALDKLARAGFVGLAARNAEIGGEALMPALDAAEAAAASASPAARGQLAASMLRLGLNERAVKLMISAGRAQKALFLAKKFKFGHLVEEARRSLAASTSNNGGGRRSTGGASSFRIALASQSIDTALAALRGSKMALDPSDLELARGVALASGDPRRTALFREVAKGLRRAGQFEPALAAFLEAGDAPGAVKTIARMRDTPRLIQFAQFSRDEKVYELAANYLMTFSVRAEDPVFSATVNFLSKAKLFARLVEFHRNFAVSLQSSGDPQAALTALGRAEAELPRLGGEERGRWTRLLAADRGYLETSLAVEEATRKGAYSVALELLEKLMSENESVFFDELGLYSKAFDTALEAKNNFKVAEFAKRCLELRPDAFVKNLRAAPYKLNALLSAAPELKRVFDKNKYEDDAIAEDLIS